MAATSPGPSSSATLPAWASANASARRCDLGEHLADGGVGVVRAAVEQRVEVPGDRLEVGIVRLGRAHKRAG